LNKSDNDHNHLNFKLSKNNCRCRVKINYHINSEEDIYEYISYILSQLVKFDLIDEKILGGVCVPFLNSKGKIGGWSDYFVPFINPYILNYEENSKKLLKVLIYIYGQNVMLPKIWTGN